MKSQLLFLLCNFVLQVSAHPDEEITNHLNWKLLNSARCGNSNAERIIGGKNAGMGAYPWIVRIGYALGNNSVSPNNYLYKCGGTLVNKFYVITAAHCMANLPTGLKVASIRLGEYNTLTNPDCQDGYCGAPVQDIQPASILVHEHYNEPPFQNDIALIRLSKPAKYTENVFPICLIRDKSMLEKTFEGEQAEVAGWGFYDLNILQASVELQTVKLPIVGIRKCRKTFRRMLDLGSAQLCAGGVVGKDSCAGDSGGPLMKVESLNGPPKYYLIGVVSFGVRRCGEGAKPAVYTRVASYTEWILNNIQP